MRRKSGRGFSPIKDGFILLLLIFLGALVLAKVDGLNDRQFSGRFVAIDGDTLALGSSRFRLIGIDAPELRQECGAEDRTWACGQASRDFVRDVLETGEAECTGGSKDRYARFLVRCSVNGKDLSSLIVSEGLAVTTEYFLYAKEEDQAQAERLGLWSGTFENPKDWRREHKTMEADAPYAGPLTTLRHVFGW
ncbi:thermonuclease family protein [Agrobacterium larrymoorei]|uniref:thermonuclease family protein n=1 Tax=Agrobacterium larrymoorei TaxID=160699 RepID=UPI0030BFC179